MGLVSSGPSTVEIHHSRSGFFSFLSFGASRPQRPRLSDKGEGVSALRVSSDLLGSGEAAGSSRGKWEAGTEQPE